MTARKRAIAVIAYAFAVTMIGTTLPTPLYPIYQQEIGFSALMVTVVFAAYGAGVLVALLFIAPLSDRYGRRALLLPGIVLAAASSVVFLLAHGLPLLFVGRILSGLSAGCSPARRRRRSSSWLRQRSVIARRCSRPSSTSAASASDRSSLGRSPRSPPIRCGFPTSSTWQCSCPRSWRSH